MEVRLANKKLWDALNELVKLQDEWTGNDYGTSLPAGSGTHEGVTKSELGAVVFDTRNAIETLLDGGHRTNMAKLL
jgi:hypothetical protein